jgi:hypothetical protein
MGREPDIYSLVRGADAAGLDHVGDEQPEQDRECDDHDEAAEHREEEGDDRMAVDEPTEPLGDPSVTRPEDVRSRQFSFAATGKDRRVCFDRGDDGDVARLNTF